MQAVVKTPRIEISVRGAAIRSRLMDVLKEEYGPELAAHFQYGARSQIHQLENGQEAFVAAWRAD